MSTKFTSAQAAAVLREQNRLALSFMANTLRAQLIQALPERQVNLAIAMAGKFIEEILPKVNELLGRLEREEATFEETVEAMMDVSAANSAEMGRRMAEVLMDAELGRPHLHSVKSH